VKKKGFRGCFRKPFFSRCSSLLSDYGLVLAVTDIAVNRIIASGKAEGRAKF
jgi:hypothetical protein